MAFFTVFKHLSDLIPQTWNCRKTEDTATAKGTIVFKVDGWSRTAGSELKLPKVKFEVKEVVAEAMVVKDS